MVLSIKEKARMEFEAHTRRWAELKAKLSDEERRKSDEEEKKYPRTFETYEQPFREAHAFMDELRNGDSFQNKDGLDIYSLFIDGMENFHPDEFRDSKITNLSSNPDLEWFLGSNLWLFFYKNLQFRCVSNGRLEQVIEKGTDREDMKTFVSQYSDKALEYGGMPKLLLVYDGDGIEHVSGGEGYEHKFIDDPKSLLQCAVRINLQEHH